MAYDNKRLIPQQVTGINLDVNKGLFSIVYPEATENIFTNPSGELVVTNFNALGSSTVTRSIEKQSAGLWGIKCVTTVASGDGVYQTKTLVAGSYYTFSADVYGASGIEYEILVKISTGAVVSRKSFRSLRKWKRPYITVQIPTNGTYWFCIQQKTKRAHTFYTDAWQLENKKYPTTYCDGDMTGYVVGEEAYRWVGTPHNSNSKRFSTTRSGGREYFLGDYGLQLSSITGLGYAPVNNFTKEITSGGEFYIGSNAAARLFTLNGNIFGKTGNILRDNKLMLEKLVDFGRSYYAQEILMKYRPSGNKDDKAYNIKCHYMTGLEGNFASFNNEPVSIQFKQSDPHIEFDCNVAQSITPTTVESPPGAGVNGGFVIKKNGEHISIFTGGGTEPGGRVTCVATDRYGGIYFGGHVSGGFTGGVVRYDGTSFTICGGGIDAGEVYSIAMLPNGKLLVGGDFDTIDGAAIVNLALYDPATDSYSAFGSPNGDIHEISVIDNYVYVCGAFTNISSTAISYIARSLYSAAGFASIGTTGGVVNHITGFKSGSIITIFFSVDSTVKIRKATYNGSAWSSISDVHTGTSVGGTIYFTSLTMAGSTLYFSQADRSSGSPTLYQTKVYKVEKDIAEVAFTSNYLDYGGFPYSICGSAFTLYGSIWNGLYVSGSSYIGSDGIERRFNAPFFYYKNNQQFYVGDIHGFSVNTYSSSAIVPYSTKFSYNKINGDLVIVVSLLSDSLYSSSCDISINGTLDSDPSFVFSGPGRLYWIKNKTTKQVIYFDDIEVASGENLTVSFYKGIVNIYSDIYGQINNKIVSGSNAVINIVQGTNSIDVSFNNSNELDVYNPGTAYVSWKENYISIDGIR